MNPADPFGLVGHVLDGQLRVERLVGEGGFSAVYRGQHIGLEEPVAIKCLKLPPTLGDALVETFVNRFRDESRILYRLSRGNLHIVRSIAAGTTVSPSLGILVPFMALEWLEGKSLASDFVVRKTVGHHGRALADAIDLFATAADALAFAHSQGVIHRDLNPGNLFLTTTPEGVRMKVLDFGVAKIMDDSALNMGPRAHTMGQVRIFAPAYGAPEQFDDRIGTVSAASDVYAFALVLLEALRDRPVNDGTNIADFANAAVADLRPTPRSLGIDVPDEVEGAFVRATARDPRQRWQTVGDFWSALTIGAKVATERKYEKAARETPALAMSARNRTRPGTGPLALTIPLGGTGMPSTRPESLPENPMPPNDPEDNDEPTRVRPPEADMLRELEHGQGAARPAPLVAHPPAPPSFDPDGGYDATEPPGSSGTLVLPPMGEPGQVGGLDSGYGASPFAQTAGLGGSVPPAMGSTIALDQPLPEPFSRPDPRQNFASTVALGQFPVNRPGSLPALDRTPPPPAAGNPPPGHGRFNATVAMPSPVLPPQPQPPQGNYPLAPGYGPSPGTHGAPPQGHAHGRSQAPMAPMNFPGRAAAPVAIAPAKSSKAPLFLVLAVLGVAALGGGGFFAWRTMKARSAGATPASSASAPSAPPSSAPSASEPPPASAEPPASAAAPPPTTADEAPDAGGPQASEDAGITHPAAPTAQANPPTQPTGAWNPPTQPTGAWNPPTQPTSTKDAGAVASDAFNEAEARQRLATAASVLAFCKHPGGENGPGAASVTFLSDGTVGSAAVDPPYAGTKEGECVSGQLKRAKISSFKGEPRTIRVAFDVPK